MNKKINRLFVGLSLLFIVVFAFGCGKKNTINKSQIENTAIIEKYNRYMDLFKFTNVELVGLNNQLVETINKDTTEENEYQLQVLDEDFLTDYDKLITQTRIAIDLTPKFDADKNARQLIDVLEDEKEILEKIHSYYLKKDSIEDNSSKRKELELQFLETAGTVSKKSEKFNQTMVKISEELIGKDKEENIKNNKSVNYNVILIVSDAIKIVNMDLDKEKNKEKLLIVQNNLAEQVEQLKSTSISDLEKEGFDEKSIKNYIENIELFTTTINDPHQDENTVQQNYYKILIAYNLATR